MAKDERGRIEEVIISRPCLNVAVLLYEFLSTNKEAKTLLLSIIQDTKGEMEDGSRMVVNEASQDGELFELF